MTEASDSKFWPIVRLLAFFAGIFAFIPGLSLVDAGYPTLGYTMAWLTPLTWLIFFVGLFLNRGRDHPPAATTPVPSADLESLDPIATYNQGAALFVDDTSTEPPKGKLAFVLNTAQAAGSGHHPPVEIPASGFPTSLPG